jgi:hypothetical protein
MGANAREEIDTSGMSAYSAVTLIDAPAIRLRGLNPWDIVLFSNYFCKWFEYLAGSVKAVDMIYKRTGGGPPLIDGLNTDRQFTRGQRFELVKSMMTKHPAPWSSVVFDMIGSKPAFYDWKTVNTPDTYETRLMREVALHVWNNSYIFGFATNFVTKPVDVITKTPVENPEDPNVGTYTKNSVVAEDLTTHFDRMVLGTLDDEVQVVTGADLISMSISNTFAKTFALSYPYQIIIRHPVPISMEKALSTIPEQIIITPHTQSGPMSVRPLKIFYADEEEIIEFDTNLSYPDSPIRFGSLAFPMLLYSSPDQVLLGRPKYVPYVNSNVGNTLNLGNRVDAPNLFVPRLFDREEAFRNGVKFITSIPLRFKYTI